MIYGFLSIYRLGMGVSGIGFLYGTGIVSEVTFTNQIPPTPNKGVPFDQVFNPSFLVSFVPFICEVVNEIL